MAVKLNIIPMTGRLIVKRDEHKIITEGGIVLAGENRIAADQGIVLASGDSNEVNDGDRIIFTANAGRNIQWEGETYYLVDEILVLGVIL